MENKDKENNQSTSFLADIFASLGFSWKRSATFKIPNTTATNPEAHTGLVPPVGTDAPLEYQGESMGGESMAELAEPPLVNQPSAPKRPHRYIRVLFVVVGLAVLAFLANFLYELMTRPQPPTPDAVAQIDGEILTTAELTSQIEEMKLNVQTLGAYREVIRMIAVDRVIGKWAKEAGVMNKQEAGHGLKHLVQDISLDNLLARIRSDQFSPDKVEKSAVQDYYEKNKDRFADRDWADVEKEIRRVLATENGRAFIPKYLSELRKNAGLELSLELLEVPAPPEQAIQGYYDANRAQFAIPEQVTIQQVSLPSGGNDGENRRKLESALVEVRSGVSFSDVAQKILGKSPETRTLRRGESEPEFERAVFSLKLQEVSSVLAGSAGPTLVLLVGRQPERLAEPSEVRPMILSILQEEASRVAYSLKSTEALFTVHGKRFTLGEFLEEFKELPADIQAKFSSVEAKKVLVDEMITKQLLLEETEDKDASRSDKAATEQLKQQYVSQVLHGNEVDDKIAEVRDDEVEAYYKSRSKDFVVPRRALISLIVMNTGEDEAARKKSQERAQEARSQLLAGGEFSTVARSFSEDPTASEGGELRQWIGDDEHLPGDLRTRIFSLKKNETTDVFEFQGGLYLIKLRELEPERQESLQEVQDEVKARIKDERHHKLQAEFEEQIIKKANLTIFESTLQSLVDRAESLKGR